MTPDAPGFYHPGRSGVCARAEDGTWDVRGGASAGARGGGLTGPAVAFELNLDAVAEPKRRRRRRRICRRSSRCGATSRSWWIRTVTADAVLRAARGAERNPIAGSRCSTFTKATSCRRARIARDRSGVPAARADADRCGNRQCRSEGCRGGGASDRRRAAVGGVLDPDVPSIDPVLYQPNVPTTVQREKAGGIVPTGRPEPDHHAGSHLRPYSSGAPHQRSHSHLGPKTENRRGWAPPANQKEVRGAHHPSSCRL